MQDREASARTRGPNWGRIYNKYIGTEVALSIILLAIPGVLTLVQIANRYWLHLSIGWYADLALYVFILFMFLAASVTAANHGHIAVEAFYANLFRKRPRGKAAYLVFIDVVSITALAILLPFAYQFFLRAIQYPTWATLVRWFNLSWLQMWMFITFILVMIHMLITLGKHVRELIKIWHAPIPNNKDEQGGR